MNFREQYREARFWFIACLVLTPIGGFFSNTQIQFGDKWYYAGYPFAMLAITTTIGIVVYYRRMKKAKDYIVFDNFLNNQP